MLAIVDTSKELDVMQHFTGQLLERALGGEKQLTPQDVISLIDDICIDAQCIIDALPSTVLLIYHDAQKRRDDSSYGSFNFIIENLVGSLERALQLV